jgi:hypothetical protein
LLELLSAWHASAEASNFERPGFLSNVIEQTPGADGSRKLICSAPVKNTKLALYAILLDGLDRPSSGSVLSMSSRRANGQTPSTHFD